MAHTHTIGSGGNYATLAACVTAHKNDTFTENHVWTYISNVAAEGTPDYHWPITTANYSLTIDGAGYTSNVNSVGWGRINPMGGTNRYLIKDLNIVASAADLWGGLLCLDMNRAGQNSIITIDKVTLNGNSKNCRGICNISTSIGFTVNVTNCIIRGCGNVGGIINLSANGTFNIENTVCQSNTGNGIKHDATGAAGFIKNCVCFGNSGNEVSKATNVVLTYCAVDDTSIATGNGNIRSITVANEFKSTTAGEADYLLPKSTGQLYDGGVVPTKSTTDFDSIAWRSPYPIGCRQSPVTETTTVAPTTTVVATTTTTATPTTTVVATTTVIPVPSNPTLLTATAMSSSQINLQWTDNSSTEDGTYIERSLTEVGGYSQIGSVLANVHTYLNTGLDPETPYWYRVRAYNDGGNSGYSNAATDTTFAVGTTYVPPASTPAPTTTEEPFVPGATYTGRIISHSFPVAGLWTITLTEKDGEGNTSVKVRNYTVT